MSHNPNDISHALFKIRRHAEKKNEELGRFTVKGGVRGLRQDGLVSDHELVLAAVTNRGEAIRCAINALRQDPDVAMIAIKTYAEAITFVPEELQRNKAFVTAAIRANPAVLMYLVEDLLEDPELFAEFSESYALCREDDYRLDVAYAKSIAVALDSISKRQAIADSI